MSKCKQRKIHVIRLVDSSIFANILQLTKYRKFSQIFDGKAYQIFMLFIK